MKRNSAPFIGFICRRCRMELVQELGTRTDGQKVVYCRFCGRVDIFLPGGARAWVKRWGPIEMIMEVGRWAHRFLRRLTV